MTYDHPAFATFDFQGYGERQLGLLESVQTTYGMITRNEDFPIQTQQNTEQGMKMQ
jgi:3-deoxy-D-arabino-heptulosonate 7-phosphate (DAHP) synthase